LTKCVIEKKQLKKERVKAKESIAIAGMEPKTNNGSWRLATNSNALN